jgi:hypothetical protein
MLSPAKIDPQSVYDDGALILMLDISSAALTRARRDGRLRFTREGRRVLYLGQWVLDWLAASARPARHDEGEVPLVD